MSEQPKSTQPKVTQSALAGALATLIVWGWNIRFPETSEWHATDIIVGAFVTLVTWFTGPLIRRYERWGEGIAMKDANLARLVEQLEKLERGK